MKYIKPEWAMGQSPVDWATQLGTERAFSELSIGVVEPDPSPLSGEWADTMTPAGLFTAVGYSTFDLDEPGVGDVVAELGDAYEAGYFGAYSAARAS